MLFHLAEPAALLGIVVAFLIGVFAHDAAQVLTARVVRDPTPLRSGRLTTGVKDRLSPFSGLAVFIVGHGWAESVPMNDVWRRRRFHVAAAVLAGPLAYLLLALGSLALFQVVGDPARIFLGDRVTEVTVPDSFAAEFTLWLAITFGSMFIVSLIPVPPTDAGRLVFLLGGTSSGWRSTYHRLTDGNIGLVILLALLLLPVLFVGFPSVVGQLIGPLLRGLAALIGLHLA
ncbi:Peptidase family M50 [Frankia torreyi]|uniref:Peptidase family M50 n=1 Tax=Frankia torreyi TaxID=1856 RepID=A0A0D8BN68_9ACTN|nr:MULTISPECIES: Zn-dependent membrane protease [Frankia]KJE24872.1 Peptidase family M50 [Frankia torreyi]KQC39259.1 Zn-dependent membrane protease [Frankia sp. ACN1ag]